MEEEENKIIVIDDCDYEKAIQEYRDNEAIRLRGQQMIEECKVYRQKYWSTDQLTNYENLVKLRETEEKEKFNYFDKLLGK